MPITKRPRVAAIGLSDTEQDSITHLCGQLRSAESVEGYLQDYSWSETDLLVAKDLERTLIDRDVNLLMIGPTHILWPESDSGGVLQHVDRTNTNSNTERELAVSSTCPQLYRQLATDLSRELSLSVETPDVVRSTRRELFPLIETTSGHHVALRLVLPPRSKTGASKPSRPIALFLPEVSNLAAWFSAFLTELHESDPTRVPQAPPRLSNPSDWYTPEEKGLVDQISEIESNLERLTNERDGLLAELTAQGEKAEGGIRRAIWADGVELVSAVKDVFSDLGFKVKDMDAELKENEPKREDLRLTLRDVPGWEAIVEVKGYSSGTKTNDARQIRQHRERYITGENRLPNLTIWLSNEYRTIDPSSRPVPDQNVKDAAELVGAVHVLSSDLYQQWALVATGRLDKEIVIKSLVNAAPGLWTSPTEGTSV